MPFEIQNFHVATEGYGRSEWQYESAVDNLAACAGSGYFNAVAPRLKNGDMIKLYASDSSGIRRVTSATGAVPVTVTTLG
jgi:hypothetical protein